MQKRYLAVLPLLTAALVLTALYHPLPLATDSDFRVLYYTDKALLAGVDIYDHPVKMELVARAEGITPGEVTAFPQFAYPPLLALLTVFLGALPIESAATLWFEINLIMLLLSVRLMTDGWPALKRLIAFPAVFLFIPVLGTLVVGQYDFPALLGAALLFYALRKQNPPLTALGLLLLTFKPHIGGFIFLAALIHLFLRKDQFGRRALNQTLLLGVLAFLLGFIADSAWPIHYLQSLLGYRTLGHITTCSECASLSIWLTQWLTGQLSLSLALRMGLLLFALLAGLLFVIRPPLWRNHPLFLNAALIITLSASPYLYNYDYVMLLIPMLWLAGEKIKPLEGLILGAVIILPLFAILLYGRDGNYSFGLTLLTTAALLIASPRRAIPPP